MSVDQQNINAIQIDHPTVIPHNDRLNVLKQFG